MPLTAEQQKIVHSKSDALRVIAFAGAGKTSTLRAYADARPSQRIIYLAFNRSISQEAATKFPNNVVCVTTHALAFRSVGQSYRHKLQPSIRASQIAKVLDLNSRSLKDLIHARLAMKAMEHFLSTPCMDFSDFEYEHSGEYSPDEFFSGQKLWEAMIDPKNIEMPMLHDGYLKLYQLSGPVFNYETVLFDEAQDANPVTLSIIKSQKIKKVFVGDPHQQIYQFRRAENAMEDSSLTDTLYLTESFRFGSHVAEAANTLLSLKREKNKVIGGRRGVPSKINAFISRGNAAIYTQAVNYAKNNRPIYFVGGVDGYKFNLLIDIWLLRSQRNQEIKDQFIRNFKDFDQLIEYVKTQDERDIKAWIKIIEKHATWQLIPNEVDVIRSMAVDSPMKAELCLATAHKSKGLEFGVVELADDFPSMKYIEEPEQEYRTERYPHSWLYGPKKHPRLWNNNKFLGGLIFPEEELNLRYVAITRSEGEVKSSKWGSPLFKNLSGYIKLHPDFIFVNNESDLSGFKANPQIKRSRPDSGNINTSTVSQVSDIFYGYCWAASTKGDDDIIRKSVTTYRLQSPQWSWEWVVAEALKRKSLSEPASAVGAALMKQMGLEKTNSILRDFLASSNLIVNTSSPSAVHKDSRGTTAVIYQTKNLKDIIYAETGAKVTSSLARFDSEGWSSVGRTMATCPRCGSSNMPAYRKPYTNSKGIKYQYWALVCLRCKEIFEPAALDETSKRNLKNHSNKN